jgi:predicted nucleic acid-binding protein
MAREPPPELVVIDASFVLRYVLHTQAPRPHPAGLAALRDVELVVPALCLINALSPMVDNHVVDVTRNVELARAYRLSAYDALYLELALRRKAALATYDDDMIAAAPSAGIRLYPPPAASA